MIRLRLAIGPLAGLPRLFVGFLGTAALSFAVAALRGSLAIGRRVTGLRFVVVLLRRCGTRFFIVDAFAWNRRHRRAVSARGADRERQLGDRVLGAGPRQQRRNHQQQHDDHGPHAQPQIRHRRRHFDPPLPQIAPQAEEAGGQQQAHAAGHVNAQQPERVTPRPHVAGGNEPLAETVQGQRRQRKIHDPHAGRVRPVLMLDVALPPAGGHVARRGAFDGLCCRCGHLVTLVGGPFETRHLQQALARGVLRVVDHRAVPGEFVGTPPDDRDQAPIDDPAELPDPVATELDELVRRQTDRDCQCDSERHRAFEPLLDRDPRDQHRSEHETGHHPSQSRGIVSLIEHPDQKEHQATDQRHDQRGADREHDVVGQGLLKAAGHGVGRRVVRSGLAARCQGASGFIARRACDRFP